MHRTAQRRTIPCWSDFSRDALASSSHLKSIATEVAPTKVAPAELAFVDINQRVDACSPTT
jgi:hypothetical protein